MRAVLRYWPAASSIDHLNTLSSHTITQSLIHRLLFFAPLASPPGGPRHAYSSSPYNGCTSNTPSPAPGPSTGTLTPPCRPTGTTICPPTAIRVSPVQTLVHAAELAFRYYYLHLLAGRAVAVYLSLFNFTATRCSRATIVVFQLRYLDIVNAWCDQRSI